MKEPTVSFGNWFKTSMCPFTIYTEVICEKKLTYQTDPAESGTSQLKEQTLCFFGELVVAKLYDKIQI